jgi:hypothetical protein
VISADLPAFTRRMEAHFTAYGRPAREELIASAWQHVEQYSLADVVDVLDEYERVESDVHPISIVALKRRVHAKREAHARKRAERLAAQERSEHKPGPNAAAFAQMWQALRAGEHRSPREWCAATAESASAPRAHVAFAAACLALMGPERERAPLPATIGPLRRVQAVSFAQAPAAESESEREARLEREAIQLEAVPIA